MGRLPQELIRQIGLSLTMAFLTTVTSGSCAGEAYSVTDLGTLGGTYIYVSAINRSGQVVGNATTNGVNAMRALVYSSDTLLDLGTLGGIDSYGYSINDSGQVVGSAYTSSGQDHAFLYSGGQMTDLGTLGGTGSDARAINNNGQIAGGAWAVSNAEYHAYLYSEGGTKTDLGTLGGTRSGAFGINDNGQVVGRASISGIAPQHAFLYSAGVMTDLGTLGGAESWAYGINNLGQVVGGADTSTNAEHAFLYSGGIMTDLGTMGGSESRAYGINNNGQVVGFAFTSDLAEHAFLNSGGKMIDLNSLIDTNTGWTLEVATAINDKGQIAGIGTHPSGQLRAFLLTPIPSLQISPISPNSLQLQFTAQANTDYVVEYRDSLSSGTWQLLVVLDPVASIHEVLLTEPLDLATPVRFYRVRSTLMIISQALEGLVTYNLTAIKETQAATQLELDQRIQNRKDGFELLGASPTSNNSGKYPTRIRTHTALSTEQAGMLARHMASETAKSLYNCEPFGSGPPARLVQGRWLWRSLRGHGTCDIEATVEFEADGAKPWVNLMLLDNRR